MLLEFLEWPRSPAGLPATLGCVSCCCVTGSEAETAALAVAVAMSACMEYTSEDSEMPESVTMEEMNNAGSISFE